MNQPSEENKISLEALIESLLFISGEPLSVKKISKILKAKEDDIGAAILNIQKQESGRGLNIVNIGDSFQLATVPEANPHLSDFIKENFNEDLTQASLETLTIIAYRGPLARFEVENIRGVNSSYILRNLSIRGLIAREPSPVHPLAFQYKISFEFLRHLGFTKIEDLPDYEELSKPLPTEAFAGEEFLAKAGLPSEVTRETNEGLPADLPAEALAKEEDLAKEEALAKEEDLVKEGDLAQAEAQSAKTE